jgi:L-malate glycosyltransferase
MTLRILHLDSGREMRGGQRQLLQLARGLRDRGHEPLVVSTPESPLLQRSRASGLAASGIVMRADIDLVAVRRLRRLLRTWAPDLVHAHDARTHALALGALVGNRRVPLVVTRRLSLVPRRARIKYGPRVTRFIAISNAVRDAMVEGGVESDRIDVVYSGVEAPHVEAARDWRKECRWPSDTVLCGVVGAAANGTAERLSEVAQHLSPDVRARTRLVFLGGQATGACDISGVPAFCAGHVDHVHGALAGVDVLLHPGHANAPDGLGTAVIDAMALGIPSIAFDSGALAEIIQTGDSGIIIPGDNVADFAAATASLVTNPDLRHRLGAAGPARSRDFSVERMIDGTERVYRLVLGRL